MVGILASLLFILRLFPYAYAIGIGLLFAYHRLRKPFHNPDVKAYPAWFKPIALGPWLLLFALFLVPRELKGIVRVLFGISIAIFTLSFSYFDYRILKQAASTNADVPNDQPGARQ